MGQKVHRKRRTYYRRGKSPWTPILVWVLAAAILIPGGFFAAQWLGIGQQAVSVGGDATVTTTAATPTVTTTTVKAPANETTQLHGCILSHTQLKDIKTLAETAKEAAENGFNCVVIELKKSSGEMAYVSETAAGKQAAAAMVDALTLKEITDAFKTLKEAGLTPVPLLYAFEDAIAPHKIPGSTVTLAGNPLGMWYDNDPARGGKAWLNPYADASQAYITALAEELQTAGAGAIMLDGVYFPTQILHADFKTGGDASLSEGEVLERFMQRMNTVCDIPVLMRCSVNAALGNNVGGHHKNPLALGADMVVVDARTAAIGNKLVVEKEMYTVSADSMRDLIGRIVTAVNTRLQAVDAEQRPTCAIWLDGHIDVLLAQNKNASYFVANN